MSLLRTVFVGSSMLNFGRVLTRSFVTFPRALTSQIPTTCSNLRTMCFKSISNLSYTRCFTNHFGILSSAQSLLPTLDLRKKNNQQIRTVTKWSLKKGKRKSVKPVLKRFYRLGWGAWIRPMVGRDKRHWSKKAKRKIRGEKHVFCNATQSTLLDKMVTKYWKKRRYYIDDIYEPYHQREEFPMTAVRPH